MSEAETDASARSSGSRSLAGGRGRLPWSRALLLLAVAGPPLWLGGVKPWVVPVFCVVVAGLIARRCLRSDERLRIPSLWWLGLFAAGVTALQWLPLPHALLELLAPGLTREVAQVIAGTSLKGWSRLSVHPGQTGLELARLLGLTGLFIAAAQLSWRLVCGYVAATGTAVAVIGLVQKLLGAQAIYGVYVPRQRLAGLGQELGTPLLTSFVNPNHQSGLLLVGLFAAAAMAYDSSTRARETRSRHESQRLADRAYLAAGAVALQVTALVLSMSRGAIVSLLIVVPVAMAVVVRSPRVSGEGEHGGRGRGRRIALGLVVLAMVGLALSQGALGQLASLRDPEVFRDKFHVAREGARLIGLSPVLGIGRGAFVDLYALVDGEARAFVFTHLESSPVAFMVEWGPVPGAVIVLVLGLWWVQSFRANAGPGRRLALCGLLALAIQSCADFSLDYLGVTAAAVALAGCLGRSSTSRVGWRPRRVLGVSAGLLVVAELAAISSIPASWSQRRARDLALLARDADDPALADALAAALAQTPLDSFVHLGLARTHGAAGEWEQALARAEVAVLQHPGSIDAHLMATTAAAELGAPLDSIAHLRAGLEGVREPVPEALVVYLCEGASPEQLTTVAPAGVEAWTALARAIAAHSPSHARALAAARARVHADELEPLRLMTHLAIDGQNPGLALHYARLAVALQPDEAGAHRLRAHARFAHKTRAQDQAAAAELELARDNTRIRDLSIIDELLVIALLRVGDPPALARAEVVLDALSIRRADADSRARREALAARLAKARAR